MSTSSAPPASTGFGCCGVACVHSTAATLVHSFVSSRVDYCNARSSGGCAESDDRQASTSDECCGSCDHWYTQVRPWPIAVTAHWTALAQRAWASHVQALHHGAQSPTRSGAAVLGRPLPTSLRRRFTAGSISGPPVDDFWFFSDTGANVR